jgi:hypothetical protein
MEQPLTGHRCSNSGILNVILHGEFTAVETDDGIQALIPANEDHVYRAGNWLAEIQLRSGVYKLTGVEAGNARFDDSRNIILLRPNLERRLKPYATLIFPFPKSITSLRLGEVPRHLFRNTEGLELKSVERIATVQVFTYQFDDDGKLLLEKLPSDREGQQILGHPWEPIFVNGRVNLHIFSAEDNYSGCAHGHTSNAFGDCTALLGSELRLAKAPRAIDPTETELPFGVSMQELEDLAPRMNRLARLGRLIAQSSDMGHIWSGNGASNRNPESRGSVVSDFFVVSD